MTSRGTKVDLGKDAPVYQEAAGTVASESLAAESYRQGGEFASNRDAQPVETAGTTATLASSTEVGSADPPRTHAAATTAPPQSLAEESAPTYVNAQFLRDPAGPHGKNITEDPDMEGRPGNSLAAEPGSKDDPGRVAQRDLGLRQTRETGTGPRQEGVDNEQPFGALGRETSS